MDVEAGSSPRVRGMQSGAIARLPQVRSWLQVIPPLIGGVEGVDSAGLGDLGWPSLRPPVRNGRWRPVGNPHPTFSGAVCVVKSTIYPFS